MTCIFFGHKDSPQNIKPLLKTTIVDLIETKEADVFYVGNHGNFDAMVKSVLKELSEQYNINYYIVLAYLPFNKTEGADYSHTVYPGEIEATPKRFAISFRNKWMIEQSDYVISYITHSFGGAAQFVERARKKGKTIINLSELI